MICFDTLSSEMQKEVQDSVRISQMEKWGESSDAVSGMGTNSCLCQCASSLLIAGDFHLLLGLEILVRSWNLLVTFIWSIKLVLY